MVCRRRRALDVPPRGADENAANWHNVNPFTACAHETEISPIRKSWWEFLFFRQWEIAMKNAFLMAAIAAAILVGTGAEAAELPSFDLWGFPITWHQVAVLGGENIHEQSPTPTLMFGGMPASPSQIAILTPRLRMTSKPTTVGFVPK
jgi:hypothetical protein